MNIKNLLLVAASTVISLLLAELILRAMGPARGYYALVPGTEWTVTAAPDLVRGVTGVGHYRVNSSGIRGRAFGRDEAEYRILAVGGSTTESAQLDDSEVWTALLEQSLGRAPDGRSVWVGNIGRSGLNARHNVVQLKYLLRQYPRVDAIVALLGVNDMHSALQQGERYRFPPPITDPASEWDELARAFAIYPASADAGRVPWYRRTDLWRLARRARLNWNARRTIHMQSATGLTRARQRRAGKPSVADLPPLGDPLTEYRRNLNAMIDLATAANARMVFVTAPSLWREEMSEVEKRDLWYGWIGGTDFEKAETYYSTGALMRALDTYNRTLLETCRERGVECIDAATLVPSDGTMFYDDVHFTEAGARRLAEVIAEHFRARAPFAQ
jgi:lysophospholipase L1-like esterase